MPLFRRNILAELARRVELSEDKAPVFELSSEARTLIDWQVRTAFAEVSVWKGVEESMQRAQEVTNAHAFVTTDPEIMGGLPVFKGTRVPIDTVLASVDKGIDWQRLVDSYPFLTGELVHAARIYATVHPRRGRPRQEDGATGDWKMTMRRVVRTAQA